MPRRKTWLQATLQMVDKAGLTHRELAERTGLGREWIASVRQGRIPNPGIQGIQRLHDYLKGQGYE